MNAQDYTRLYRFMYFGNLLVSLLVLGRNAHAKSDHRDGRMSFLYNQHELKEEQYIYNQYVLLAQAQAACLVSLQKYFAHLYHWESH